MCSYAQMQLVHQRIGTLIQRIAPGIARMHSGFMPVPLPCTMEERLADFYGFLQSRTTSEGVPVTVCLGHLNCKTQAGFVFSGFLLEVIQWQLY